VADGATETAKTRTKEVNMGLLVECPKCSHRNSLKTDDCKKCGRNVKKASGKTYWIEYYFEGSRKRERVGPSKAAAEQRLREVLKARTEERYIDTDKAARTTLEELSSWYLQLPEVRAKKSYRRDQEFVRHLHRLLGASTKLKDLTAGKVETYQQTRLAEPSPRHLGQNVRPATVNKEVMCLKTILNRAVRHGRLDQNPVAKARKLPENNVRMRILSQEEFKRLLAACADHLKPVVLTAYYTGMRKSEILRLTWDEIDLKTGFIRLAARRTKTNAARSIPLHPYVRAILERLPRGLRTGRVFLRKGRPFSDTKIAFSGACQRAGIEDFTFHDLRHCALNNLRLAGNDYFRVMAISGHKTMSVFKRYNLVTEEELSQVKWNDENDSEVEAPMDTYMDTKRKKATTDKP
jgi:integrase